MTATDYPLSLNPAYFEEMHWEPHTLMCEVSDVEGVPHRVGVEIYTYKDYCQVRKPVVAFMPDSLEEDLHTAVRLYCGSNVEIEFI